MRKAAASPLFVWLIICLFAVTGRGFYVLYSPFGPDQALVSAKYSPGLLQSAEIETDDVRVDANPLSVVFILNNDDKSLNRLEQDLLAGFAESEGRDIQWHFVSDPGQALKKIDSGEATLIASITPEIIEKMEGRIISTIPWAISKQQVIGRSDSNVDDSSIDLTVRQVAMKKSSPSWRSISDLANDYKTMEVQVIPENTNVESILQRVKFGQYDLAVMNSLELPGDLEFKYNLETVLDLSEEIYLSWGVNKNRENLQTSLNQFISKKSLESEIARSYKDDFPLIKDRKLLRLITYQSPVNYYYEHGRLKGFEYDLVKKFTEIHGLRLDVVVADNHENMLNLLKDGKGDIIAASVPEPEYANKPDIKLSEAYNYASPVLIGRSDEEILDIHDLAGRTIHLPAESPYLGMLNRIREKGLNFSVILSDTGVSAETVLFRIAENHYDLTVLSSHEAKAELSRQLDLDALISLGEPNSLKWVVRESNTQLLYAINEFIQQQYRKGFYNVIHARYIDKPVNRISNTRLLADQKQLSPYDEIVHKYADIFGFDWRLIVAQMYQESRFNPHAVSYAGAEGLMQILPKTADMIGVKNLRDPDANIKGGLYYMNHIRNRFEGTLTVEDRTWFTLASYNAGYRRVKDARKLAASMGLNKNVWFNNVELAMLKLATPRKYNGFTIRECRCGQTVVYVREIRTLYNNYLRLTQSMNAAARAGSRRDES